MIGTVLACPRCGGMFDDRADLSTVASLVCISCGHRVPVISGIPRFVTTPDTEQARRTQASFGYEWTHFRDWQPSGETNFNDYFAGLDMTSLRDAVVLDAGCGMGRHARQIAPHARAVVAVDFSAAIEQAARNTAPQKNVQCIQADLTALPLREAAFDYVYSLGVLHHIADTEGTLARLAGKVKPGGRLRVYLYWQRSGLVGALLSVVSAARLVTTRLPFPVLKAFCWILSVLLFATVIVPYRILDAAGVRAIGTWPLFVYTKYPFNVLYNDQFDRFSAPLEKRYTPEDVRAMLERVGLTDITVRPCFGWVGEGVRPTLPTP
jgi:SAM-dependent methyltransferase